jgi:hypothetical protein
MRRPNAALPPAIADRLAVLAAGPAAPAAARREARARAVLLRRLAAATKATRLVTVAHEGRVLVVLEVSDHPTRLRAAVLALRLLDAGCATAPSGSRALIFPGTPATAPVHGRSWLPTYRVRSTPVSRRHLASPPTKPASRVQNPGRA